MLHIMYRFSAPPSIHPVNLSHNASTEWGRGLQGRVNANQYPSIPYQFPFARVSFQGVCDSIFYWRATDDNCPRQIVFMTGDVRGLSHNRYLLTRGCPLPSEREEAASRWAPVVWLHPQELYFPGDVHTFLAHVNSR